MDNGEILCSYMPWNRWELAKGCVSNSYYRIAFELKFRNKVCTLPTYYTLVMSSWVETGCGQVGQSTLVQSISYNNGNQRMAGNQFSFFWKIENSAMKSNSKFGMNPLISDALGGGTNYTNFLT